LIRGGARRDRCNGTLQHLKKKTYRSERGVPGGKRSHKKDGLTSEKGGKGAPRRGGKVRGTDFPLFSGKKE